MITVERVKKFLEWKNRGDGDARIAESWITSEMLTVVVKHIEVIFDYRILTHVDDEKFSISFSEIYMSLPKEVRERIDLPKVVRLAAQATVNYMLDGKWRAIVREYEITFERTPSSTSP